MAQHSKLNEIIEPVVTAMNFEFVGLEYLSGASPAVLRIYIDQPDGINVDDCALVSRQVSAVLDVEDPISSEYNLEVSSPGLNRPLFTVEQYQQCLGEKVQIKLRYHLDGRRKFTGIVRKAEGSEIELMVDNEIVVISVSDIDKGNMVFNHG